MKKTSINILCCLILAILGASILLPAFNLGSMFMAGFTSGYESGKAAVTSGESISNEMTVPVDISFNPHIETFISSTDSICFENSETYPMIMTRAFIFVPEDKFSPALSWTSISLSVISLILFVFLMIEFIKFIININKGYIFDNKNVKRLKRFSYYLISISVLKCVAGVIEDCLFSQLGLEMDGYSISSYWLLPWGTLLLGLLSLLMAQVWSRGIEMKEEQELTI